MIENLLKINMEFKMNRFLLIAVSVAVFLGIAISNQPLTAQVFDEYGVTTVISQAPYRELGSSDSKSSISASRFALPPNFIQGTAVGRDDGFYKVSLPFTFEFNGEEYNSLWICVNGFVMFTPEGEMPPATIPSKNPTGVGATGFMYSDWFFYFNSSYPKNIIAPYMGDHFYRRDGDENPLVSGNHYVNSEISTGQNDLDGDGEIDVFIVQWKNLNINFDDPLLSVPFDGITSSVGNFQVKLYKSKDIYTNQGDMEFCYGQVNVVNPLTTDTRVITRGAVIGIKGASGQDGQHADFLNGLVNIPGTINEFGDVEYNQDDLDSYNKNLTKTSVQTTTTWQPSGGSDYRIRFFALGRNQKEEFWGDGDANLSQMEGQLHGYPGMNQSRFVTVADARAIIRSIVTRQPLPRERRREAYHADVNHNGRYFYYNDHSYLGWNTAGTFRNVYPKDTTFIVKLTWKNNKYSDSIAYIKHRVFVPALLPLDPINDGIWKDMVIPSQISSLSQIYFEATELDAALILHYIGGRLPMLPFLLDSFSLYGKVIPAELLADGIEIGKVISLGENTYKVPVYLNGSLNGPLAIKARFNGKITNATSFNNALVNYSDDLLVIAGAEEFSNEAPVCMLTVVVDDKNLNLSELRFNDNELSPITVNLTSVEQVNNDALLLQNIPNPFTDNTIISVNLPDNGNYSLSIFDAMGKVIKSYYNLESGDLKWNGLDDNGNPVSNGIYIYRLNGDNLSVTKSMILSR
jgi:hypothetical protein